MPAVWQNSWIIVQWLIKAKSIPVPPVLSLHCSSPTVPSAQRGAMRRRRRRRMMMRTVMFARGLEKRLPLIFVQRTKPRRLSGTIWKMCFHSAYSKYNCSFFFFFFFPQKDVGQILKRRWDLCQLPWRLVSTVGRRIVGGDEGRVHIWVPYYCGGGGGGGGGALCIITLKGSLDTRRKTMVQVTVNETNTGFF